MKKDALIFAGVALAAVAIGVFAFLYKEPGNREISSDIWNVEDRSTAKTVPFTELARGSSSTVPERVNYAITSADQLIKLWKMVDATGTPPKIDFNTEAVIAVFAGEQPTTGYAISVAKIEDTSTRMVSITLANPAGNCVTGQALTAPYQIVALPATALPLTHEDIQTTIGCTD